MSNQKVVLITGASSGVGQATARLLSQKGYKVFGTTRNPTSAKAIPAFDLLALDVRNPSNSRAYPRMCLWILARYLVSVFS